MMKYDLERVTVQKPVPVGRSDQAVTRIVVAVLTLGVVGVSVGFMCVKPMPTPQTRPDAGPSAIFGQTMAPEPISCPEPEPCPDCTFLSRFVYRLDVESANPREVRDVLHRSYIESRYTPTTVSETGDWGICQINAATHPETDAERLLVDPEYAAVECLRVYRAAWNRCGKRWECCYRHGVKGCRNKRKAK